jgi:hypothetical protein
VRPLEPVADPLPQALVLTAIVIAFGVLAFTLVLFRRAAETTGMDNLDEMRTTDHPARHEHQKNCCRETRCCSISPLFPWRS